MNFTENLRNSLKSLSSNRLRTFLTMLGVIIGVFSVIMLTSIGEGLKGQITAQVESLGANLIYVFPGKVSFRPPGKSRLGAADSQFGQVRSTLVYNDVLELKTKKDIASATGIYNSADILNDLNLLVSTTGVDEDYIKIRPLDLKCGRFFNRKEREEKAAVAVIGFIADKEIFGGRKPAQKTFKLNGKDYRVVGVLAYKKPQGFGPGAEDLNIKIYLPVTEMIERNENKNLQQIIIKTKSAKKVGSAEAVARATLKKNHPQGDFSLLKQQDMLKAINNILGILTAALGGIAAISLLVGGIGIMNIMLVSVAERTREIGVRKAVGARHRDILVQFLIESVVLSLIGGLLGMSAGIAGAKIIPRVFPSLHTEISTWAVSISLLFAILVGIFFGVYPAAKAARMDPIDALRSE